MCETKNWRNRFCCYSCQAPHPGGEAHADALREEGAEQARLRELGRCAQPGWGDEAGATGGDGSGDAAPGTKEYGHRLARMAEAAEQMRKEWGETAAASLREQYEQAAQHHAKAKPLDVRVSTALRHKEHAEAKLEAKKKRLQQLQEEAKAKTQEAADYEQVVAEQAAKLQQCVAAIAEVRDEAEREGALAGRCCCRYWCGC